MCIKRLDSIEVKNINRTKKNEIMIEVMRIWQNGQFDESLYVLLLEEEQWKVHNRL